MSSYTTGISTSSVATTGNNSIDSLSGGAKYGGAVGTGISLTYSFPWTTNTTALWANNYGSGENTATTHYGFSETQRLAAISALGAWSNVANISFTELAESGNEVGDIRFGVSSMVDDYGAWGWSYLPTSNPAGGDVWIASNLDAYNSDFSVTGYGYHSLVHELGHVIGFKHPGDYGMNEDGPFLPADTDNKLYTVMSYNAISNNTWIDASTNLYQNVNSQTPMIYDILAAQHMYGANMTYKTGNDKYTFDDLAPFRMTIWDAGGIDTISVESSSRASLINLNEGSFSSIQTNRAYSENGISDTVDGSYNLGIAYGAVIENATGGSGNDKLIGNKYSNVLDGGAGVDTMIGGLGNDTYHVDNTGDVITESANEGTDYVGTTVTYTLGDNIEHLNLWGVNAINGTGNALNNDIHGNSANNTLSGGAGGDYLVGWAGDDTMIGGTGNDYYSVDSTGDIVKEYIDEGLDYVGSTVTYILGDNLENLSLWGVNSTNGTGNTLNNDIHGNSANNTLSGGAGSDYIVGWAGNDTMIGGTGNDYYSVDSTGDTITENANEGIDLIYSTIAYTLGENQENLILWGTNAINGTGNALNNDIYGNSANNTLSGGAGSDYIVGGVGSDTMIGGTGNDYYSVDNTGDTITENVGEGIEFVYTTATYSLSANIENLNLSGIDAINGTGNELANDIHGNSANNILKGDAGGDYLVGWAGDDSIAGGNGNDYIVGGAGLDTIIFDTLLSASTNKDTIIDFSHTDDTISLDDAIFNKLAVGALASDMFANGAAMDSNDYILYNSSTGELSYDSDGNGAGVAVVFATISNKPLDLAYNDFMVI